ncbi:MAG: hypothetical protein JWM43_620 [Acidobacteriaceae bacterium]|nr:hypothetical protein [Acidobacteriaceae bacterium]
MFPYDSILLAAASASPASIDDVIAIMQTIDATCTQGDGLYWFNSLYLQVTHAVKVRVAAGGFQDPAWITLLDVKFAQLYFNSLAAALRGQPAPGCWSALFNVRNQVAVARIQFALAGVNAHINHDLAVAIVATSAQTGTSPRHGTPQYADYTALNSTLDGLIEIAKHTLNVRLLGEVLPPVSRVEDTIAAWSVSAARESAWNNAEILQHLQPVPLFAASFLHSLDGLATVVGKSLLVPVPKLG